MAQEIRGNFPGVRASVKPRVRGRTAPFAPPASRLTLAPRGAYDAAVPYGWPRPCTRQVPRHRAASSDVSRAPIPPVQVADDRLVRARRRVVAGAGGAGRAAGHGADAGG